MARTIGTKQQPKLTYCAELRRCELRCRFEDRGLAKRARFAWDPPYWQPPTGKHSDSGVDLGNQALEEFLKSWPTIIHTCKNHLAKNGELAFIISPTQTDDSVIDHAFQMWRDCADAGLATERRIIVYQTQEATDQQVELARRERKLLTSYRDLVIMRPKSEQ